jgi:hypothetical protein
MIRLFPVPVSLTESAHQPTRSGLTVAESKSLKRGEWAVWRAFGMVMRREACDLGGFGAF